MLTTQKRTKKQPTFYCQRCGKLTIEKPIKVINRFADCEIKVCQHCSKFYATH